MKKSLEISTVFVTICLLFIVLYEVYPLMQNHRCDVIRKSGDKSSLTIEEKKICHIG